MRQVLACILAALLCATSTPALAQSREHIRPVGADVRFAVERSAAESRGPMSNRLNAQGRAVTEAASILAVLPQDCDVSSAIYWDDAGRWIAQHTLNVRPRGNLAALQTMTHPNALRATVRRSEQVINAAKGRAYLAPNESVSAAPADLAMDLRQRAEWTAYVSSVLTQMRAAHEAEPRDFGGAYSLALWSRTACRLVDDNARAARKALAGIGYPFSAQFGPRTEEAFALLVSASDDAQLAQEALTLAGDRASPTAREALAATSTPPAH